MTREVENARAGRCGKIGPALCPFLSASNYFKLFQTPMQHAVTCGLIQFIDSIYSSIFGQVDFTPARRPLFKEIAEALRPSPQRQEALRTPRCYISVFSAEPAFFET